jgi:predicted Fe-S protein YdhL (DUF1289 family)
MTAPVRKPLPPSPCVGICEIDAAADRCRGCARTAAEVDLWRDADPAWRETVWAELPARAAAMGLTLRRLSWEPGEILDFVEDTLRAGRGRWEFGVWGAGAEIPAREPFAVTRGDETIEAVGPRAALRIRAARGTRAFAWREREDAPERIALAIPAVRLGEPGPACLAALGEDDAALLESGAGLPRFDLGLGRAEARFTVRTHSPALTDALAAACGAPFPDWLGPLGGALLAASPVRVIETPLGRAEVATPIPPPGTRAPDGPRTELLLHRLARGLATPPLLQMPSAFAAGCVFYPAGGPR